MALNFPIGPSLGTKANASAGKRYKFNGTKWTTQNTLSNPIVTEYTDLIEHTSSTILIEPSKYNYFKINVDADVEINIPNAAAYSNFVMQLDIQLNIDSTFIVTWGDNIKWSGGSYPSLSQEHNTSAIIQFITYDGVNWVGSPLSLNSLDKKVVVGLTRSSANINEGVTQTITLNTKYFIDGTAVPYTVTGIDAVDLSDGSLTGNFIINNNTAEQSFTLDNDQIVDGLETAIVTITITGEYDVIPTTVLSTSWTINDTSTPPLISELVYSGTKTASLGTSGFNRTYCGYLSASNDGRYLSLGGEYGPAIWVFGTPGDISSLTLEYAASVPPGDGGNGGGGATLFNEDGSVIYYLYVQSASGNVFIKIISWGWDGSSLTYISTFTVNAPAGIATDRGLTGAAFNSTGTYLFFNNRDYDGIYRCELTTPYDMSTLQTGQYHATGGGFSLKSDGSGIIIQDGITNELKQYDLDDSSDLSDKTLVSSRTLDSTSGSIIRGIVYTYDGSGIFIFDQDNNQIDKYVFP
jgi:hypothetical protein